MTLSNPPFHGACLCGAVQVRLTALPLLTLACHCRDCQKLTASAYSLTTMFPKDSFSCAGPLLKGGRKSSGRDHYYCASCLNFIYSVIGGTAATRINLRTSLLENAALFAPYVELMTDEKIDWATTPAMHSLRQGPESLAALQALMEGYKVFWSAGADADHDES